MTLFFPLNEYFRRIKASGVTTAKDPECTCEKGAQNKHFSIACFGYPELLRLF